MQYPAQVSSYPYSARPDQQPYPAATPLPATVPSVAHLGINIPINTFFPFLSPTKAVHMVTLTPDNDIPLDEEPIEAGNLRALRGNSNRSSKDSSGASSSRRISSMSGSQYDTQQDNDKEEVARAKRKEEAYKTALCEAFRRSGECSYGKQCRFAHGEHELRLPNQPRGKAHPKYKTQLCDKFSVNGHCPYGPRCQFIHMMKKGLPLVEYERCVKLGSISPTYNCEEVDGQRELSRHRSLEVLPTSRRSAEGAPPSRRPLETLLNSRRSFEARSSRGRSEEFTPHNTPQSALSTRQHTREAVQKLSSSASQERRASYAVTSSSPAKLTTPRRLPPRAYELSLIHEETEHQESPPLSNDAKSGPTPQQTQGYADEEGSAVPPRKNRRTSEDVKLLNESCDEELLTNGAYTSRYPDPPKAALLSFLREGGSRRGPA